jgi:hypothetical protein
MARTTLIVLAVVCLTVLGVVMITKGQEVGPTATIYNPYSPGILPADWIRRLPGDAGTRHFGAHR